MIFKYIKSHKPFLLTIFIVLVVIGYIFSPVERNYFDSVYNIETGYYSVIPPLECSEKCYGFSIDEHCQLIGEAPYWYKECSNTCYGMIMKTCFSPNPVDYVDFFNKFN